MPPVLRNDAIASPLTSHAANYLVTMSKTPRLRASSGLRGGRLQGKGKEVLGARKTPGAQEEGGGEIRKSEVGSRKSEKDILRAEVSLLHGS